MAFEQLHAGVRALAVKQALKLMNGGLQSLVSGVS